MAKTTFTITFEDGTTSSVTANITDAKIDKAILIAFPDQNPDIPKNQSVATWLEEVFGDGDGKANSAGHAGIAIINGETGNTRYFDFGRYERPDISKKRGADEGAVRSSANYGALSIPNWNFNNSNKINTNRIISELHESSIFDNYGTIMGSLAEKLDFNAMLKYAENLENKGYHAFGGYSSSTKDTNPTYCAKFARGVAESGGFDWSWYILYGKENVEDVNGVNKNGIITIEN